MTKIMLVEDDNNLREIYEARLLAEGYEIVSAKDGEEALAIAVREKPDLIIADVMMPKISGFDMLDILRSTPETKNTKVIMMTALSQAEDKARAEKLGADRYLVKSQVTLEDVARVAQEVLTGEIKPTVAPAQVSTPAPPVATAPAPTNLADPIVSPPASAPASPAPVPEPTTAVNISDGPSSTNTYTTPPTLPQAQVINIGPPPEDKTDGNGSSRRIIQPINDLNKPPTNLTDLAAKEDALASGQEGSPKVYNPTYPTANTVIAPSIDSSTL